MRKNLSVLFNQRIILIIYQGRHQGSVFGTISSEQCLSQRARRLTKALARARVKGSFKAFHPKGRAIRRPPKAFQRRSISVTWVFHNEVSSDIARCRGRNSRSPHYCGNRPKRRKERKVSRRCLY